MINVATVTEDFTPTVVERLGAGYHCNSALVASSIIICWFLAKALSLGQYRKSWPLWFPKGKGITAEKWSLFNITVRGNMRYKEVKMCNENNAKSSGTFFLFFCVEQNAVFLFQRLERIHVMDKCATNVIKANGDTSRWVSSMLAPVSPILRYQLSHLAWDFLQYIHKSHAPH